MDISIKVTYKNEGCKSSARRPACLSLSSPH